VIIAYVLADSFILTQFSVYTREPVISQISAQFITVEGILIATTPLIKSRLSRELLVLLGIPAILASVGTFATSTYQALQQGYSSYFPTTLEFWSAGVLFLVFVEAYAVAILFPSPRKEPRQKELLEPLATDLGGLD